MFDKIIDNIIIYAKEARTARNKNKQDDYIVFRNELRHQIEMLEKL